MIPKEPAPLGMVIIFVIIILAAAVPVFVILWPQLEFPQPEPEVPQINLSADAQRYFDLKNISCSVLSRDFLIVTDDIANGTLFGLTPSASEEFQFADMVADSYDINQTTKTYLRGDQMKKGVIIDGKETITIWKNGRVYTCQESCAMKLMDENESEEYYDELHRIRSNCMHFGKTEPPESADLSKLLDIEKTGVLEINGYRCENFLITGNSTYAESLNETLTEDQRALFWSLAHLDGPVQECLDESTGIIVLRNLTIDLTDSYQFDFQPDGYFKVNQVTRLTYFSDYVPESFLALPDQS